LDKAIAGSKYSPVGSNIGEVSVSDKRKNALERKSPLIEGKKENMRGALYTPPSNKVQSSIEEEKFVGEGAGAVANRRTDFQTEATLPNIKQQTATTTNGNNVPASELNNTGLNGSDLFWQNLGNSYDLLRGTANMFKPR
jgi:hypothetical protein